MRWARKSAGLSHDRLVREMGRSNRGHVIKIEQGLHTPRQALRDDWADATNVPRDLFDDEEAALSGETFRGDGARGSTPRARRGTQKASTREDVSKAA